MKKIILLVFTACFCSFHNQIAAQNRGNFDNENLVFRTNVYFDFGKSVLKSEASAKLTRQIDSLRNENYDIAQISLCGNTDAIGSDAANEVLSRNRCTAVQAFLMQRGVAKSQLKTVGKGELAPVADNETDNGRQQNRRVEVEVLLLKKAFVNVLAKKSQNFAIRSGVDTMIVGAQGTVFRFRNDVFDVPKGTKLNIAVREALTYPDMILDRLTTVSEGRLLETGGMIKLDVTDINGVAIPIKRGKTVQVRIPNDKQDPRMQTFYGQASASGVNMMQWGLPTRPETPIYYDPEKNPYAVRFSR